MLNLIHIPGYCVRTLMAQQKRRQIRLHLMVNGDNIRACFGHQVGGSESTNQLSPPDAELQVWIAFADEPGKLCHNVGRHYFDTTWNIG